MAEVAFGIHLPSSSVTKFGDIVSYARKCEDLGFDSVWVADHILSGVSGGLYEPLTTLAALSGSTERVRLGTSVLIASMRSPVLLADITGTIQEASSGRLILGVGVGWDRREFESLGVDFEQRGAATDECLKIVRGLWKPEAFSYEGAHFTVKDVMIGAPTKRPPPIWIGGNSLRAIRRAAKYDAWFPTDPTVGEIKRGRAVLTRLIRTGNRPMIAAHIYLVTEDTPAEAERSAVFLSERTGDQLAEVEKWAVVGDAEVAKKRIGQYLEAGASYFVFTLPHTKNYEASLDRVARLVSQL